MGISYDPSSRKWNVVYEKKDYPLLSTDNTNTKTIYVNTGTGANLPHVWTARTHFPAHSSPPSYQGNSFGIVETKTTIISACPAHLKMTITKTNLFEQFKRNCSKKLQKLKYLLQIFTNI